MLTAGGFICENQDLTIQTLSNLMVTSSSSRDSISPYQISNNNPQKDNFHNVVLGIDKMVTFGILDPTVPINFYFPKGWWMEKNL